MTARQRSTPRCPAPWRPPRQQRPQFFDVELPAVAVWEVDTSLLARIEVPVLNVVGAASSPRFVDGAGAIQRWLPRAQHHVVPGVGHLLMAAASHDVASRLDAFWRSAG